VRNVGFKDINQKKVLKHNIWYLVGRGCAGFIGKPCLAVTQAEQIPEKLIITKRRAKANFFHAGSPRVHSQSQQGWLSESKF